MYDLLITGADVLQLRGRSATVLSRHSIAIAGGRIAAIAPEISPDLARELLPARDMLAIPGFVNAHAHAAMGLFRGVVEDVPIEDWFNAHIWPMETNLTDEDVYWGALLGFAEMIEAGVTTVADHYFAMEEVARAAEQIGIRADLAPTLFSGPDEQARLASGAQFVERWHGAADGRITARLGPHSNYTCTPEFLTAVAGEAARLGVGVHIHLSETAAQVAQSLAATGKTPVAVAHAAGLFELPALAAHVAHPSDDDMALMARCGVAVASTPKTEMKLGIGVAPVGSLRAAGVTVGLGSDGAASNNGYDILEAARMLALLEKHRTQDATVLPVGETLALATREGARAIGLGDVTGELRAGLAADVVLVRRDGPHVLPLHDPAATLLYSSCSSDVDTVIVAGRVLMRNKRLLTIDRRRVLREATARARRLTQRREGRVAYYPEAE
jgi:5-methylthioadenosine/S-adenosylhomocysteine deaminase